MMTWKNTATSVLLIQEQGKCSTSYSQASDDEFRVAAWYMSRDLYVQLYRLKSGGLYTFKSGLLQSITLQY